MLTWGMKEPIAFIGAGNVAWHLSHALSAAGYPITAIASKRRSSAKKLAQCFSAAYGTDVATIIGNDEACLFITAPDSAIASIAHYLCRKRLLRKNQLVVHTSGLFGTRVINCVKAFDSLPLSMHPAYSFSSRSHSKNEFHDVWFVLQGSKAALRRGKEMVKAVKGKHTVIAEAKKPLYHLALVFASNLFVGIEDMSIELLAKCGITRKAAQELVVPLVNSTFQDIQTKGTRDALTGPMERGDIATIKKHLAALAEQKRAYRKTYLELSRHLARMVEEKGELPKETIRDIKKLLKP
jgi:predicted short-subunit dehydrogenase-like oxidoreductase (DUF2520 family)